MSWVSRRLALVELLPETIQQQVREGKIAGAGGDEVSGAGGAVNTWKTASGWPRFSPGITARRGKPASCTPPGARARRRSASASLIPPELFLKTQRQAAGERPAGAAAELMRDLEMVTAIVNRAQRRLTGAAARKWTVQQRTGAVPHQIERTQANWAASTKKWTESDRMLSQSQRTTILELDARESASARSRGCWGSPGLAVRRVLRSKSIEVPELHRAEKAEPYWRADPGAFSTCKGNLVRVHEELVAAGAELSYPALTAFCRRHRIGQAPPVSGGPVSVRAGRRDPARHVAARGGTGRQETQSADGLGSAVLLADAVLSVLSGISTFRLQGLSHRRTAVFSGATEQVMIDNTHVVVLRGTGREMIAVPEMAGLRRAFRVPVRGA